VTFSPCLPLPSLFRTTAISPKVWLAHVLLFLLWSLYLTGCPQPCGFLERGSSFSPASPPDETTTAALTSTHHGVSCLSIAALAEPRPAEGRQTWPFFLSFRDQCHAAGCKLLSLPGHHRRRLPASSLHLKPWDLHLSDVCKPPAMKGLFSFCVSFDVGSLLSCPRPMSVPFGPKWSFCSYCGSLDPCINASFFF